MADEADNAVMEEDFVDGIDVEQDQEDSTQAGTETVLPEGGQENTLGDSVAIDTATEQEQPQETPEYPAHLLAASGYSQEDAHAQFGSPEALEQAVRWHDRQLIAAGQGTQPQMPARDGQSADSPEQTDLQSKPELPTPPSGQEWDEDVQALMAHVNDRFERELAARDKLIDEQNQRLAAIQQAQEEKRVQEFVEQFDDFIDKLPDQWTPVFGKGPGYDLDPDSFVVQNRIALARTAQQLNAGRQVSGMPLLPPDELLQRSLGAAFPEQQRQVIATETSQQAAAAGRGKMKMARPTARRSEPHLSGTDKAVKRVQEWYSAGGAPPLASDEDDYEEI